MSGRTIFLGKSSESNPICIEVSTEFADTLAKKVAEHVIMEIFSITRHNEELMSEDVKNITANGLDKMALCGNTVTNGTACKSMITTDCYVDSNRIKSAASNPYLNFIHDFEKRNNCRLSEDNLPQVLGEWDELNDDRKLAYIKEAFLKKLMGNKEIPKKPINSNESTPNVDDAELFTSKATLPKRQRKVPKGRRKTPKKRKAGKKVAGRRKSARGKGR
ncbi:uncharacterized protein LOC119669114 [Teleopsis dalmanni]|uniref:uncharacterized protein LOC119664337 n=1 Tax=Teleopsis dalmanni TaxID=139649 RepID=UPI0018CDDD8F|nr:uncharacterized protein LOC119664337 [Teleopsis dalmanni]XP_037929776.1 uncharacterized protein LOC119664337 [Teleopsis dalmanni]XP_037934460.1 uncharacterized protein LOC119668864 [Teleopsis dalmanni]XP_037934461.1 uncharacterized protein LOC119668864 [Teleopsis dalmanni]XP_037934462.1 uncharacterized protein LOC119668864 [Teleopsis dalmanni]XP_037934476.1 uncharacterized protein LOC119668876 [Teleopsis dalmanni]XP_037934477.1 uncharacterized protein LOC119668876 [Teleopsis dalmanni]XP_0